MTPGAKRSLVLVLTWNLYHGRAVPPAGRDLQREFESAIAGWEWDIALLQEVPPWWPPGLAAAAGAEQRTARTSRNRLLAVRKWIAQRFPDVIKSNGGGANAILVRTGHIAEHRHAVLRRFPERRVVHAVRLDSGVWIANLHAQVHSEARAQADMAKAAATVLSWAGLDAPAILGGDANTRDPVAPGFELAGGDGVDHVLARHLSAAGHRRALEHGHLSDHAPVLVELREGSMRDRRP